MSLIVVSSNSGHLLVDAMESIFSQTVPPDEILIIDDASDDGSRDLLSKYHEFARVVVNEHALGIVESFRKAVSLTTGDYVAILRAENRLRADYIEQMREALSSNPNAAVAYSDIMLIGPNAPTLAEQVGAKLAGRSGSDMQPMYHWQVSEPTQTALANLDKNRFIHETSMYRRTDYNSVGGYTQRLGPEDQDLFKRMILKGRNAIRIPQPLVEDRQQPSTHVNNLVLIQQSIQALKQSCEDKDKLIVSLQQRSLGLENEKKNLERSLSQTSEILSNREEMLANTSEALARARGDLKKVRAKRDHFRHELKMHRASLSWRITSPIRITVSRFPTAARVVRKLVQIGWWTVTLQLKSRLHQHLSFRRKVQVIVKSGLFDRTWYRSQKKGLKDLNADPVRHYLVSGWKIGLDPHPLFSTSWYVDSNPYAATDDNNPFVHYLVEGGFTNKDPNPFFSSKWYLEQHPDVKRRGINPLVHYIQEGAKAGIAPSSEFDADYYVSTYPDVSRSGLLPFAHYVRIGSIQGRETNSKLKQANSERRRAALGKNLDSISARQVALGIVTYNNSKDQLARALRSCAIALRRAHVSDRSSVYMIDNGHVTELENINTALDVRKMPSRGNIGFGSAHNLLMKEAFESGADAYVAVNPDGALHPNALAAMLRMSEAAAGSAIVEALQVPEEHPKIYDHYSFDTPWASGACMLLPKRIWNAIGGFDDSFFMYCEDVDISWRARAAGFSVKTCVNAMFYHPINDREPDRNSRERFLSSGLILAHKWGGEAFKLGLLAEMKRLEMTAPDLSNVEPQGADSKVANFNHLFNFAETRW
ncbi:glycosyltransferase [Microvirga sp. CF3016]|uniref:glycosyltransferase n=1 Tax=Microvirga sp. CF3016 TaxID=3110181 RepID=UPI002E7832AD|nr:glycosyltransferase [Microvirga sp. CF3016]MEE1610174.1 glycosyltransferase [Microvirga sp. CF3016]